MDDYDFVDAIADLADEAEGLSLKGCAIVLLIVLVVVGAYFLYFSVWR